MQQTYRQAMHQAAREYFTKMLLENGGDVERVAVKAEVSTTTVYAYLLRTRIKALRQMSRERQASGAVECH